MGSTGFCRILRFLRKPAPPKCCNSQEKRKSAKISENLRKTANSAPFVPFSLSLLVPLEFWTWFAGFLFTVVHFMCEVEVPGKVLTFDTP